MLGEDVILKGKLTAMGEHSTHMVVEDGLGRILVVLTDLADITWVKNKKESESVLVLGTVEKGKKGLPFINANSISD